MACFTTRELEALAKYAHDAGYNDHYGSEEGQHP